MRAWRKACSLVTRATSSSVPPSMKSYAILGSRFLARFLRSSIFTTPCMSSLPLRGFCRPFPLWASNVRRTAMQIRHAQKGDEAHLAHLLEEHEHHYGNAVSRSTGAPGASFLVSPPHGGPVCLVAELDGRLLGFAILNPYFPGPGLSHGLFLKELYVAAHAPLRRRRRAPDRRRPRRGRAARLLAGHLDHRRAQRRLAALLRSPRYTAGEKGPLRDGRLISSLCLETPNAETVDRHVGRSGRHQLRHHGASAGPELEAMRREAELVIDAFRRRARPDHGNFIGHARLDAGPGAHDGGFAHRREQLPHRPCRYREPVPVEHRAVLVAERLGEMATADHHGAIGALFEGELAAA